MPPGADPLAGLRGIHLPPPPGAWPPAPGWWLLGALLLAALVLLVRWLWRLRARRHLARGVGSALSALARRAADGEAPGAVLAELSVLLRRAALLRHARARIAGLAGEEWVAFLSSTGAPEAAGAARRALLLGPYGASVSHDEVDAALAAARAWLARNF